MSILIECALIEHMYAVRNRYTASRGLVCDSNIEVNCMQMNNQEGSVATFEFPL